ncbi:hypothetical protein [Archangium sp.]|uniref:hypothetical protein n=1 Tax=Archangium sp. TaxID=1872627 RepID=UPI002D262C83|nr:hypothetical protein [Archangium sp.]HYO52644.1 hypothetical protein [Archangium sp.]
MAASGDWAVSLGANAIRLEYYVDGAAKYYEERIGIPCGPHSFQVKAYPMVVDSAGTRTTCSSSPASTGVYSPAENCPTPTTTLSCSRYSTTQIKCTVTAAQGTGSYTPYGRRCIRWTGMRAAGSAARRPSTSTAARPRPPRASNPPGRRMVRPRCCRRTAPAPATSGCRCSSR